MEYKFSHKSSNITGFGLFTSPCTNTVCIHVENPKGRLIKKKKGSLLRNYRGI
jgi:hypothetical protein